MLGTIRLDRAAARMGATPIEVTPDGFKVYRGSAAYGDVVYEYPERGVNELVPAKAALDPAVVATLVAKPFTIHHPEDLLSADDPVGEHAVGTVRAAWADLQRTPPELIVEVVVWTREAQEAIESGAVVELSPGYRCASVPAPSGSMGPGGIPYQAIQQDRIYNHLSAVTQARGETPDGRRARLDQRGGKRGDSARAPYAPISMFGLFDDQQPLDLATPHVDAGPAPDEEEDKDAEPAGDQPEAEGEAGSAPADDPETNEAETGEEEPGEVVIAQVEPAADLLAKFSPDDAERLKMLSPEGMAMLMAAFQQVSAEEVEQAVMAAPPALAVEVEAEPKEQPAPAAASAAAQPDATVPMAPQGLTSDAIKSMVDEIIKAAIAAKNYAPPLAPAEEAKPEAKKDAAVKHTAAARIDAAAVAAQIAEQRRMDAAFIEHARKDGHISEGATVKDAAVKMLAVIGAELPDLLPMAKAAAADPKRRDADFVTLYQAAEKKRRDGIIADQEVIFEAFAGGLMDDSDAYDSDATAMISNFLANDNARG